VWHLPSLPDLPSQSGRKEAAVARRVASAINLDSTSKSRFPGFIDNSSSCCKLSVSRISQVTNLSEAEVLDSSDLVLALAPLTG
jgi:hypothetical protein